MLEKFALLIGPRRVFNIIADKGPQKALEKFGAQDDLRIIACGGDGTVGWVLQGVDEFYKDSSNPRPYVSIIPLGTGNDLSRALSWGGKYQDKPLKKILSDTAKADKTKFDRWNLTVSIPQGSPKPEHNYSEDSSKGNNKLPLDVMNNYISLGIDGQISLHFHNAREANPEKYKSRTRNLMFYTKKGGKDLFKKEWKKLMNFVTVECDGVDYTPQLKKYGAHSLLFLNINSYAGGTKPWSPRKGKQSITDGMIEMVALDNYDLAVLQAGGTGACVCQCKTVKITTSVCVPMQVDGEPCLMAPCTIEITHKNQARMLIRNKKATCEYFQRFHLVRDFNKVMQMMGKAMLIMKWKNGRQRKYRRVSEIMKLMKRRKPKIIRSKVIGNVCSYFFVFCFFFNFSTFLRNS